MTITVREALKIGCLVRAKVLAGAGNLDREIRAVDIIEVPDAALWFRSHSLLATTFYALRDNVEAQLQMLYDIVQAEGSGLIIFSPERYLPRFDQRLLQTAEELNLPLLQMPDASYVDVIVPLMSAILDRQVQALEYAQEIQRQMTSIILLGKGLAEIVYTLCMLIGHTVLLTDREYHIKALAVHDNEDLAVAEMLQQCLSAQTSSDEVFPKEIFEELKRTQRPIYYCQRLQIQQRETLFYPVIAGREDYGTIIVLGLREQLEVAPMVAVQAAAIVIALAIIQENAISEAEHRLKMDFFNELLLSSFPSEENAIIRARQLGLNLENKRAVIVIEPRGAQIVHADLWNRLVKAVESWVASDNPKGITIDRVQGIVVLLDFSKSYSEEEVWKRVKKITCRLQQYLSQQFSKLKIGIGVGKLYESVSEISDSYYTAKETLVVGSKILDADEPAFFRELEAYRLLYNYRESVGFQQFYNRTFARLLSYDEETGNELAKTLETYLLCGYAKNKTARRLHIHRNSLNYRLKKIEGVLGESLEEGIHLFPYQMASVIHKLLS